MGEASGSATQARGRQRGASCFRFASHGFLGRIEGPRRHIDDRSDSHNLHSTRLGPLLWLWLGIKFPDTWQACSP